MNHKEELKNALPEEQQYLIDQLFKTQETQEMERTPNNLFDDQGFFVFDLAHDGLTYKCGYFQHDHGVLAFTIDGNDGMPDFIYVGAYKAGQPHEIVMFPEAIKELELAIKNAKQIFKI